MGEANLKLTADDSEYLKKIKEVQEATAKAVEGIKKNIESITGAFEKVNGMVSKFTAILAGGAAFREIIASTKEWGEGNIQLSKALGISSEKATVYQTMLQHLGINNDTVVGASLALSKQIYNNAAAFEKAHIATRDATTGGFRPVGEVLMDVAAYLRSIKDPIERNIAGIQLLGKGYAEYRAILKLTDEAQQQAAIRAKELGLATDPEAIHEYTFAMRDVSLVVTALQNQLGKQLLPVLTNMGRIFADTGPNDLEVFSSALKIAAYLAGTVAIEFDKMGRYIGAVAASIAAFGKGWGAADSAIKAQFDADIARLNKDADELWDKLNRPPPKPEKEEADSALGPHDFDSKEKSQSQIAALQDVLNRKKIAYEADAAAHGELLTFSYEQEMEYWSKVRNLASTNAETRIAIDRKVEELTLNQNKKNLEGKLAALKTEEEATGKNLQARLAAEMKYAAAVAAVYKDDPKKYQEAQQQILVTKQAIIEQQRKIDAIQIQSDRDVQIAAVSNAEAAAKEQYTLKQISLQQLIALERQYQNEKYQLELKAAADELAIVNPNDDPAAYAEKLARIRAVAAENQQQLSAINQKGTQDQLAQTEKLTNAMTQGFSNAFQGILKGTETLHKAMSQIYSNMITLVVNTLAKILSQTIATHLIQMTQTKEQQAADASAGAVAAGKSAAAIPVVGWSLSLGAMAAFFAAAAGFGSAEGGYDIPAGVNPMTQLHQREMVLPAPIADPLREAIMKGQLTGGRGGPTYNISALDSKSFSRALKQGNVLRKQLADMHRRGYRG